MRQSQIMLPLAVLLFLVNGNAVAQTPLSLQDCPTDYALLDSTCTCLINKETVTPSRLFWKDPTGKAVIFGAESQTSLSLPFNAVKAEFNGMAYTCELADRDRPSFITYTPKVAEPPSQPVLEDCPTDFILPTDDIASCTCTTTNLGIPPALLLWEDPEQEAVTFTNNQTSLSLLFRAVKEHFSERTYQCVLRHITGDLRVPYKPYLVVRPEAPVLEGLKQNYAPGEMVQMKCTVPGGVPGTQKVLFYCANHQDRPDRIEGSQLTSSLIFQAKTTDNSTQCDCYGTNDFLLSSMRSFILRVGVTGDSESQPRISLEDCPGYVVSSTSVCTCVAENLGNTTSNLLWKDPDGQTKRYTRTSNSSVRLTLNEVDAKFNKRQYQCELLHSSGNQRIWYTLQIAEPPSQPYLVNCSEDGERSSDHHADCIICMTSSLGKPEALFVWYDPDQNPVVFTWNQKSLVLPFAALNETYRGQAYRCVLRHITGDLVVEYTPVEPIEASQAKRMTGCLVAPFLGLFLEALLYLYW